MTLAPRVYISFPGTAEQALRFYTSVFGGDLALHSFEEFGRTDGPATAIAHGELTGTITLGGADIAAGEPAIQVQGLLLSLLGAAPPAQLHRWFDALAHGGRVVDPLAKRPWGAVDGQVIDQYGLRWLIGYEPPSE